MSGPAPRRGKTRVVVARPVTRIVSPYARRRLTETSGPFTLIKDHLAGGAPRLAALLLPQILPVLPPHRAQHARWGPGARSSRCFVGAPTARRVRRGVTSGRRAPRSGPRSAWTGHQNLIERVHDRNAFRHPLRRVAGSDAERHLAAGRSRGLELARRVRHEHHLVGRTFQRRRDPPVTLGGRLAARRGVEIIRQE